MKTKVIVSSAGRNKLLYPNSTDFKYTLRAPLRNVQQVKVRRISMYNTAYIINKYNQKLVFSAAGTDYTVTVSVGNYDPEPILDTLTATLNASGAPVTFSITYNTQTLKYTISANASVTLRFSQCPLMARLLGFDAVDITGTSFTSAHVIMFAPIPFYYLCCEELTSRDETPYRCLGIILNDKDFEEQLIVNSKIKVYIGQCGLTLNTLTLTIRDNDYNIVDLNGAEWIIELEIKHLI